jgi:glycosyltransferase involved in cell wall biosynthesis
MLVSVIIPTFNRSKYLRRAVKSVIDQNFPNFEILICDNGSTDDSKYQCHSFGDSRVNWFDGSGKTRHPGAMRNLGLQNASGEIVCFLDSDDYWLPTHLAFVNKHLSKHSAIAQFFPNLKRVDHFIADTPKLTYQNFVITSSVAFRKSLLQEIGYMPYTKGYKIYEDFAYWLRISSITDFNLFSCCTMFYNSDSLDSVRKKVVSNKENLLNVYDDFESWANIKKIKLPFGYYSSKKLALARANMSLIKNKFF